MKKDFYLLLALTCAAISYALAFPNYLAVAITLLLFIGWASAWDILGGWAGQVSLGHAAFVGIGAYSVALGASKFGIAPWWAMIFAAFVSALLALIWGACTFKLSGPYFSLSTIAVAEILRLVAINENWLTGGATGVFIDTLPEPFGIDLFHKTSQYFLALIFAVVCIAAVICIAHTRFGYQLRAVREDEQSAMAAGINPRATKMKAFVFSAVLTSIGGGIFGMYLAFIEPHITFALLLSIQIALTAIIGGRGTVWGPAVGAGVLILFGEFFRTQLAQANMLVYGVLILVVVLFFPRGVLGELVRNRIRRAYAASANR